MRIQLPHGNSCTPLRVSPANWKSAKKITGPWLIYYRFYSGSEVKQVGNKGMNVYHEVQARREATKIALGVIENLLQEGYNPITNSINPVLNQNFPIDPETPFTKALLKGLDRLNIDKKTKDDIKLVLNKFNKAATGLSFHSIPIRLIQRRHIKLTLEACKLSAFSYNRYRAYLRMIFTELVELEVIEGNPISDIKRLKTVSKIRLTLTDQERIKVDEHLKKYPSFRRFTHIFFHSGARESELMRLKVKDVDLKEQVYKCVIRKGKQHREVLRTIKNIALPLWEEVLEGANSNDYVFSVGLMPGPVAIRVDQITKRWYKHVKIPLGINADFYSLKHSNASETVDILSEEDAAKMMAHKGTAMVKNIYDVKRIDRQTERLKNISNKF